jgi:hypothetical protein
MSLQSVQLGTTPCFRCKNETESINFCKSCSIVLCDKYFNDYIYCPECRECLGHQCATCKALLTRSSGAIPCVHCKVKFCEKCYTNVKICPSCGKNLVCENCNSATGGYICPKCKRLFCHPCHNKNSACPNCGESFGIRGWNRGCLVLIASISIPSILFLALLVVAIGYYR